MTTTPASVGSFAAPRWTVVLTADKSTIPYADVAGKLGTTEGAVKVAVHRLRKRYRQLLREEIAHTVASPVEIDEEIRHLFAAFH